jgi:hypothetical protein
LKWETTTPQSVPLLMGGLATLCTERPDPMFLNNMSKAIRLKFKRPQYAREILPMLVTAAGLDPQTEDLGASRTEWVSQVLQHVAKRWDID